MKLRLIIFSFFLGFLGNQFQSMAQTITLSSPSTGTPYIDNLPISITISGETSVTKVKLVFTYTSGVYKANIGKKDSVTLATSTLSYNFSFNPSTITTSTLFSENTGNLVDGVYSIYANYTRTSGAIVRSSTINTVTIDTRALQQTIISPAPNAVVKGTFYYRDSIPEGFAAASKKLSLQSIKTGKITTIVLANIIRNTRVMLNTSSIKPISDALTSSTDSTIEDGTYLFSLVYRDLNTHTASPFSHFVTIDSKTLPPIITKPLNNIRQNSQLDLIVNFPEQLTAGSAKLLFKKVGGRVDSLVLVSPSVGANNYAINLKNLSSSNISNSSTSSLSDGTYDIIVKYQDAVGNVASSDTISNFTLDQTTLVPTLVTPNSNQILRSGDLLNLDFNLPEQAKEGSVKVNLIDGNSTIPVILNTSNAGSYSISIDPLDVKGSTNILNSPRKTLPNGNYILQVSYQDLLGNEVAISESKNILIDRETEPLSNVSVSDSTSTGGFLDISYTLPENALGNTVKLLLSGCEQVSMNLGSVGKGLHSFRINGNNLQKTNRITKSTQPTIPNGDYAVYISYQDTLGNIRTESIRPKLHVRGVTPPPILRTKTYNPICNDTLAMLNQAITSDTTGLTVRYYSDSTLVNEVPTIVAKAGKYFVKVTNVHDLDVTEQITVQEFTICPEGLNKVGTKTRNRHKYVDKNGKIGNFRTVDKNGVIISIPH